VTKLKDKFEGVARDVTGIPRGLLETDRALQKAPKLETEHERLQAEAEAWRRVDAFVELSKKVD